MEQDKTPSNVSPGAAFMRGREAGVLGRLDVPLGLGLLRLSTEGRPDRGLAVSLIQFALQCGLRLLDTGDSYGLDENDLHYGESLAREAIEQWPEDTSGVRVITKVGLTRRGNRWIPNGRPEHLREAVLRSRAALGVDQLPVLLLHVHDPQTPFEETLAALAQMQSDGLVEHLGLCNTSVGEIQQAQRHFEVALIQNELSVLKRDAAKSGLLQWTQQEEIPFLAHRPLGGHANVHRIPKSKVLEPLAARHGMTPHQVALAALLEAGPHVIPLIGATRGESVMSSVASLALRLDVSDQTALAMKYSFQMGDDALAALPLASASVAAPDASLLPDQGPGESPEVVLLMGIQGAGKSELVQDYLHTGYLRLNRDEIGGTLDGLVLRLEALLNNGQHRVVLDNTYPTRLSRAGVVTAAHRQGVPVRCRWLNTPLNEAHKNIVLRMLSRYGLPLGPEEMKAYRNQDPNLPPPQALARWHNSFEPPQLDEGFGAVDILPFERRHNPDHTNKGLLLDVDGTLRQTLSGELYPRHPDDQQLLPRRRETLERWIADGYHLFFVSNQSGVASGKLTLPTMQAVFLRTAELLQLPVTEISYCPHPAYPVGCFCRKPMPGLGVYLIERHQLDIDQVVMVGDMDTDAQFAMNLGVRYFDQADFFSA